MSNDPLDGSGEAEAPNHLSPGFLVGGGRYTLLRQIARGGMGMVWLAHDERLSESVALKFLSSVVRSDAVELARLRQETQKSRKLTHTNIIRIYDLYEAPGEPAFISMEYVNGPNLWEWRTQQANGVFAWSDLKPLVKQLCDALVYAHGERVIHRDLKPTNLMLAENRRLKLADFGLAAVALQVDLSSVERRFGGGTLTHMSPQQLEGEAAAETDDIYSLGATLYDLLCGQPPSASP
jgi:serine/threonine protein kinase